MMSKVKQRMMDLLWELLKDSKRSDRELAKVLGVSQPTVTRMRRRLVEEGWIKEFTIIPDFVKIGYEIMAITCVKTKMNKELLEKSGRIQHEKLKEKPNIIFAGGAHGMGKNAVMISLHQSFADFSGFLSGCLLEWGSNVEEYDTLLISLKARMIKPFSLKYLAKQT